MANKQNSQVSKELEASTHFIKNIIHEDLEQGKHQTLRFRFPPEPNGFLHIGHAKAICLNFGLAKEFVAHQATCNLRFDDTNPLKEDTQYVDAIKEDVRWLGYRWVDQEKFASDYFEALYEFALRLIKKGLAYVCDLKPEEIREYRGTLSEPGRPSPYRDRSIEENYKLFLEMKEGKFQEGERVLRAKIQMDSGNLNMRDPIIYRIRKVDHHRTGNKWCIYPMYDYTHCLSDALEGITHSLCTLEFEDHRPLYDWFVKECEAPHTPRQIEFSRLNLNYTVTSKRLLRQLVEEGRVAGWDDPRLPTICGLRRRGYTPASLRNFCERLGVSKKDTIIQMGILEECLRDDLNQEAPRALCVKDPIKVVITNYPEDKTELLDVPFHPQKEEMGRRQVPFAKEIYIDRDDFSETPPPKYFRLKPGGEVRLRYGYVIRCDEVVKDPSTGQVLELHCHYDPNTLGKKPEGRKVKGVIHWVAQKTAKKATLRLYDRLFRVENPVQRAKGEGSSFIDYLNSRSLELCETAWVEPSLGEAKVSDTFQFERLGYFRLDEDSQVNQSSRLIFNRSVGLKDTWGDGKA